MGRIFTVQRFALAFVFMLGISQSLWAQRVVPPANQPLAACVATMAQNIFEQRPGIKVLITRFSGKDAASEAFANYVGSTINDSLPAFVQQALGDKGERAGLRVTDVQSVYVPCQIFSHEDARQIGKAWSADIVLWGNAIATAGESDRAIQALVKAITNPPKGTTICIGCNNEITAGAKSKVTVGLVASAGSGKRASFRTSLTAVGTLGLQSVKGGTGKSSGAPALERMDFGELVPAEPLALLNLMLGLMAAERERHQIAAQLFQRIPLATLAQAESRVSLLQTIGKSQLLAGDMKEARAALQEALGACEPINASCRGTALLYQCWQQRLAGESQALETCKQALSLLEQAGDLKGQARVLQGMADIYHAREDLTRAAEFVSKAMEPAKKSGDIPLQLSLIVTLGFLLGEVGEAKESRSYCEQALELLRRAPDTRVQSRALYCIGQAVTLLGDPRKALASYEQALQLSQQLGDASMQNGLLFEIAKNHTTLGEKQLADTYYEQLLKVLKQQSNSEECGPRAQLARVLQLMGRIEEALRQVEEASACLLKRNPPERNGAATLMISASVVASGAKLWPRAEGLMRKAEQIGAGIPELALSIKLYAARLASLSGSAKAAELYDKLEASAGSVPADQQDAARMIAQLGRLRLQNRARWGDCPGVGNLGPRPGTKAAAAAALRPGDVILRFQGKCIADLEELTEAMKRTSSQDRVLIDIWRGSGPMQITTRGGGLGITLFPF